MTTPCRDCPLRRQPLFVPFTEEEILFMERFKTGELVVGPGTTVLMEGSNSPQLYTVLRGQGVRHKTLENGRRQVINFLFPGDFTGLQAGLMGEMKHSVEARTQMTLCVFDRAELWQLFKEQPARAYDLTWIAAVEEHFLGETIATLGQRWTTRIIVKPGAPLVRKGPYRFLNHPNYLIVTLEIAVLPSVFGLWRIALLFSLLNAVILAIRIREENRALASLRS